MSFDDRYQLFGEPADTLAAEAVHSFRQRDPDDQWPFWDEAVARLCELATCDEHEAEDRIAKAIKDGEVHPHLFEDRVHEWGLRVDEAMAARIARRGMEFGLTRRDEENC